MKNLLIAGMMLASFQSFSADTSINCVKAGSKLVIDNKTVTIESSDIAMTPEEKVLVAGAGNENSKIGVVISFQKKDLSCSQALANVINCSGKTKKAEVTINVSQQSQFGSMSSQMMRKPVKIETIDISTSVGSDGGIVLGSEPTTVSLDKVSAKSAMFVNMNGGFPLSIEQAFKAGVDCK